MTINELISTVTSLSHAEKIRLVQAVMEQLAQEDASPQSGHPIAGTFDPRRFFGSARHSGQKVDHYLALAREGWN